ncbi:unnamed protein product [Angiostrongylus costaricensis]|uniref:DUF148 domain-containing protein n=1 Tax=Angiostrongylus costaricensis TaxID=334426 RepID=A0A0R3PT30_ANGCS|nr:unnamed protein product [Angiostrongylus costaricensis]
MKGVAILLCIGYALCYPGYNPYDKDSDYTGHSHDGSQGHSYEDFLEGLSGKAISEYTKIVQRTSQTIEQMEKALGRWAKKYGVENKYKASVEEHKRQHEEFERSVDKLLKVLAKYFKEYVKLVKDKKMTIDGLSRKNLALFNKLDEKQKHVVSFIVENYLLNLEGIPGDDGGCSGDCGEYPGSGGGYPGGGGGFPGSGGGYPGGFGGFQGGSSGFSGMNEGYPESYENDS